MIEVGVIGAGYWGTNLVRVLEQSRQFKVMCVADSAEDRGNCSVDDLLARDDVDAVVIATPASTHYGLVSRALSSDKHVLCEKPLCVDFDDAEYLCNLADENRLRLMVDHTYVYSPALTAIRKLVEEHGPVLSMWSQRAHNGGPGDVNALWDLLPHDLAICAALAPQWWDVFPLVDAWGDVEAGTACFSWAKNRLVVEYSRRSLTKQRYVSIHLADGSFVRWVDYPVPRVFLEHDEHGLITMIEVLPGEALADMVEAFADSIHSCVPAPSSGRSALPLIAAIAEAEKMIRAEATNGHDQRAT